jgi:hypothetical protein
MDVTNQGSAFRNAWKKMTVLAPFLWPKTDVLLQFRVLFCFLLLTAGRVINLYVPIYSKLIGEFGLLVAAKPQYSMISFFGKSEYMNSI